MTRDGSATSTEGRRQIAITVNGEAVRIIINDSDLLIDVLRDKLGLTSVKRSCDIEVCGTCTVLVNGLPVSSCTTLAYEADGKSVRTVEGMATEGVMSPLQQAFISVGALQCGFCTPGFLLTLEAFLEEHPNPSWNDLVEALEGNICRCTGYLKILQAAEAAVRSSGSRQQEP